jgi:hypothetical protein
VRRTRTEVRLGVEADDGGAEAELLKMVCMGVMRI